MKKAQDAFRTISEVSEVLETPAHVLRFWESKFYQIKPVKRAGGRRYYRPDDMALLSGIRHLLQDQGLTIRGVQRMLQEQGPRHVASLGAPLVNLATLDGPRLVEEMEEETPSAPARPHLSVANADDLPDTMATAPQPADTSAQAADGDSDIKPAPPLAPQAPKAAEPVAAIARAARAEDPIVAPPADVPALSPAEARNRIAHRLRSMPRGALGPDAGRAELLARRIDKLLERMSEASGAGRW